MSSHKSIGKSMSKPSNTNKLSKTKGFSSTVGKKMGSSMKQMTGKIK